MQPSCAGDIQPTAALAPPPRCNNCAARVQSPPKNMRCFQAYRQHLPCSHHRAAARRRPLPLPPPRSPAAAGPAASTSSSRLTIRPAVEADVPQLAAIEQLCGALSAGWDAAQIQAELGRRDVARVLVATDAAAGDDAPLGYIVGWLVAGELQVLELAVDPAHQGRGAGSALLCTLLNDARCDAGAVLEVRADNGRAIALYERHGFAAVGRRRRYYVDGADALLMARGSGA